MKKTLTVNLNGRVFNIDEDAYALLDNYLSNLRVYFRKEEGSAEIIADFESRIEELFSERIRLGYQVITIEHVEAVIERMGRPADFGDAEISEAGEPERPHQPLHTEERKKKKLYRNVDDKMFGGVCSGIAAYFNWNVIPVRIIFIILMFATSFWFVPVYLLIWMIVPGALTAEQKLEMRGEAITLENIGKTVAAENAPVQQENKGCIAGVLDFIVAFLKVCLVGFGCLIGIPMVFVLVIILIVLFGVLFGIGGGLFGAGSGLVGGIFGATGSVLTFSHPVVATIAFIFIIAIPLVALIYSIVAYFAKLKPLHKGVKWVSFIAWVAAVIVLVSSGFHINLSNIPNGDHSWSVTWGDSDNNNPVEVIEGNGMLTDREETLPAFKTLKMDELFIANLSIVQSKSDTPRIVINGDSNFIDKVVWTVENGELSLSMQKGYRFKQEALMVVRLETPSLKGVKIKSIGGVTLPNAFKANHFDVEIDGAGSFRADSLYCEKVDVNLDGVGSVSLGGKATNAGLHLKGAGEIKAIEMVADTVYAKVEGVGSIRCNPVQHLKGGVNGIGKITYKSEPKTKSVGSVGIGKVGLDR